MTLLLEPVMQATGQFTVGFQEKARFTLSELACLSCVQAQYSDWTGSFSLHKRKLLEIVISQAESKGYTFQMVFFSSYLILFYY